MNEKLLLRQVGAKKKKNKYGNTIVYIDGIRFQSKREANKYKQLKLMVRAKKIRDLLLQVPFILQEGFINKENGKKIQAIKYYADFVYFDNELNKTVIYDSKGVETPEFKLKEKMLLLKLQDDKHKNIIFRKG